jgi:hypothetical protein
MYNTVQLYNTTSDEPGRYIRKTSYRKVNWISLDEWMTPLNRGVEIFYEIQKFKILKDFKDVKIEIEQKVNNTDKENRETTVHQANYTFTHV